MSGVPKEGALRRLLAWRRLRRARREARDFSREVRRLLRRHGAQLPEKARARIEQGLSELGEAVAGPDETRILKVARALNAQVDKHLGFARKSTFREYVESIGLAVFIALLLRAFVVEAFQIPSGSMIPTLRVGDHIFVNKFVYGLRAPFTKWWFAEWGDGPKRGEIVVFMFPEDESKDFIKRIVAIPGDTLELRDNELVITDAAGQRVPVEREVLPEEFEYREEDDVGGGVVRATAEREVLGDSAHMVIFRRHFGRPDFGPVTVKPGHVFVMGDNRDNSHDARFWGPRQDGSVQVPIWNIKGRAMFIWWSSFDFRRIGSWIE